MRVKLVSCFALFSLTVAILAPGAAAGGWASAAVVDEPGPVIAGEPFTVRYVVRAHGGVGHELEGMKTSLRFSNREFKEVIEVTGAATSNAKVYTATVTLPAVGAWKWTVVTHNYFEDREIESPMPTLTVTDNGQPVASGSARTSGMTAVVTITDSGFYPASLQIEAGDMVTWVNEGTSVHQVAADAFGFETSPLIQPREAFFQTIVEPGTYDYLCPPHPSMMGTIIVT